MNFRLYINGLLWAVLLVFTTSCQKPTGWAVYYGDTAKPKVFTSYKLVVLDRLYPFSLKRLIKNDTQVVGYVSLGEITVNDPWYQHAKAEGLLLQENPHWPGSYVVDIRNPLWQKMLLEEVIPPLIQRGFAGLMFDTLDSPVALEEQKPGMEKAAVQLVKAIREAYPHLLLIQNRGYHVLEETAPMLNYVLAESTFTNFDPAQQKHILRSKEEQDYALNYLYKAKAKAPAVGVLGLEYWDLTDVKTEEMLTKKMFENNMLPYISNRTLVHVR
jgi:uncharacterized protein (TIGR01370 family)